MLQTLHNITVMGHKIFHLVYIWATLDYTKPTTDFRYDIKYIINYEVSRHKNGTKSANEKTSSNADHIFIVSVIVESEYWAYI